MLYNGINFVNLTPHALTVLVGDEETVIIPASGDVARVSTSVEVQPSVAGIPVVRTIFGSVEGLPDPEDGTVFIVSSMVAQAISGRDDVLAPGDLVRNDAGQPVGCKGLKRV